MNRWFKHNPLLDVDQNAPTTDRDDEDVLVLVYQTQLSKSETKFIGQSYSNSSAFYIYRVAHTGLNCTPL